MAIPQPSAPKLSEISVRTLRMMAAELDAIFLRGAGKLRPCGCRYGASSGYREHYRTEFARCRCCGRAEWVVRVLKRSKAVCADCLRDGGEL